jgi:hypothetical protein
MPHWQSELTEFPDPVLKQDIMTIPINGRILFPLFFQGLMKIQ